MDFQKESDEIKKAFCGSDDLIALDFSAGNKAFKFFTVDGLVDKELFEHNVIKPLKSYEGEFSTPVIDRLNDILCNSGSIQVINDRNKAIDSAASGDVVMLFEGCEDYYVLPLRKYITRSIAEPPTSSVVKGPREGFIEDFKTNLTLIRRKLKSSNLVVKNQVVGRYSKTNVAVVYINNLADKKIVEKIKKRISEIDIDGIVDSSYIARFLEENKYSLFSQIGSCEKPDIVAAKLLEGRVAVVVDGSPIILTLPYVFFEAIQDSQDYYTHSVRASVLRIIRILGQMLAIFLPAIYVAFQEFQYQMFPLKFLLSVLNAISGIPLSPTLEMICILIIFEILNEASVRMPRYIGVALSIVGAIVLGDTAVKAGLISSPSVLICALSTIGLYCVPDLASEGSTLRLLFVGLGGVFGLFGVVMCIIYLSAYLCSINNYGTPYLAPFAPLIIPDLKDGIFKSPLLSMKKRPYSLPNKNRKRMK